jgi:hypothetical protein
MNISLLRASFISLTICLFAFLFASEPRAAAQTPVALAPVVRQQFFNSSGIPLAGGCVATYASGTSTPQATYTDSSGSFQNANPITLDAGGFAGIWLSNTAYRIVVFSAPISPNTCATMPGNQQYLVDNVTSWQIFNSLVSLQFTGSTSYPAGTAGEIIYRSDLACLALYTTTWNCLQAVNSPTSLVIPMISTGNIDGTLFVDGSVYPISGAGIQSAINALPSTGGEIRLSCGTYTATAPILLPAAGLVKITGCGTGSTGSGGTRLVASSGSVTPILQIQGTNASTRATNISLKDFTIQGIYTVTQLCMTIDHASVIELNNLQFYNCGQAEWVNDAYLVGHHRVSYIQSGSGGTNTTATVRVENTSNPGIPTEEVYWDTQSLWQGGGQQGTAVYIGPATEETRILGNKLDYSNGSSFPLIYMYQTQIVFISDNTISGYADSCAGGPGVIFLDGTGGTRTQIVNITDNLISFSNTCPGIQVNYANAFNFSNNIFLGQNAGTAINMTVNALGGSVNGLRMFSTDTPVADASNLTAVLYSDSTFGQIDVFSRMGSIKGLLATGTQSISGCTLSNAIGGSWAGSFKSGVAGLCTATITLSFAAPNGWQCDAADVTTVADTLHQIGYTPTTCIVSGTTANNDIITWKAVAF